jgi:hypothetical protein
VELWEDAPMSRRTKSIAGFAISVLAAVLMLTDVLNVEWGAVLGMIGLGLIAAAAGSSDED